MTFFCCWLRSWASVDFPAMVKLPGCWEWSIILRTVRLIHRLSFGTRAPLSESLRGWGQTQKFNEWIPGGGQTQVRPVWWWVMLFWCNEWFPVWFLMTFFVLTHFSVSFLVGWIRAPPENGNEFRVTKRMTEWLDRTWPWKTTVWMKDLAQNTRPILLCFVKWKVLQNLGTHGAEMGVVHGCPLCFLSHWWWVHG